MRHSPSHQSPNCTVGLLLFCLFIAGCVSSQQQVIDREIIGTDGAPMMLVPAGEFLMGSDMMGSDTRDKSDFTIQLDMLAHPANKVYLDAFYIDKYEVTTALYAKFFQATARKEPEYWNLVLQVSAGDRPVIGVDWDDADAYCQWAGKRLPTEAEWEKAARGTDGHTYPWGNSEPSSEIANYGKYEGIHRANINYYTERLTPVGSYESGKSPYGVYDMAGNAFEWVADWYDPTYYQGSPERNPKGPAMGKSKVRRGGSWFSIPWLVRPTIRIYDPPRYRGADLGFRCTQDAAGQ